MNHVAAIGLCAIAWPASSALAGGSPWGNPDYDVQVVIQFDVSGINSFEGWALPGTPTSNDIVIFDAAAGLGLPAGTPMELISIGWEVMLEAYSPSFLHELTIGLDDNVNPDGAFFFVRPGAGDFSSGIGSYSRLADDPNFGIPGPPVVLPNGELYMQFYEFHDGIPGGPDGQWVSGHLIMEFSYQSVPAPGCATMLCGALLFRRRHRREL